MPLQFFRRSAPYAEPALLCALLACFYGLLLTSVYHKSPTFDEPGHITAGYSYLTRNDYRLDPENGNLPELWFALPQLFYATHFPSTASKWWTETDDRNLADEWLYRSGNDPDAIVRRGRAMAALIAVGGGFLVWSWSRKLFGPLGALLSLALFITFPGHLANGGLMTSDLAASVLLLAATGAWWRMLRHISLGSVVLAGLSTGALFLSKMSAFALVPIAAVLVLIRLFDPQPVTATGARVLVTSRQKLAGLSIAAGLAAAIGIAAIWAGFGFRYAAINPADGAKGRFYRTWEWVLGYRDPITALEQLKLNRDQEARAVQLLQSHSALARSWEPGTVAALDEIKRTVLTPAQGRALEESTTQPASVPLRLIQIARDRHLLPEAYLYGVANVFSLAGTRGAFLNGDVSKEGWLSFFPILFAIKTPLLTLLIFLFALGLIFKGRDGETTAEAARPPWLEAAPLLTLFAVYWLLAIFSQTNIGHRHLLPIYGPLFVLCGVVGHWACNTAGGVRRWRLVLVAAAPAVGAAEVARHFPNYLTYFNGIVSPETAYRHVVDSSLDWGQELPATARYIRDHPELKPFTIAYFGMGSPQHYGIEATDAYSYFGADRWVRPILAPVLDCTASLDDPKVAAFLRANPDYDPNVLFNFRSDDGRNGALLVKKAEALQLHGGTFLISASLTQPLFFRNIPVSSEWTAEHEATYLALEQAIAPLLNPDPLHRQQSLPQNSVLGWQRIYETYAEYRFRRFSFFLRHKKPETSINHAVLVYRLTDAEVRQALHAPVSASEADTPPEQPAVARTHDDADPNLVR